MIEKPPPKNLLLLALHACHLGLGFFWCLVSHKKITPWRDEEPWVVVNAQNRSKAR